MRLIDVTEMSKDFYEFLGTENSKVAFKDGDGTHHNNYGAYELAKMVLESIRPQKLPLAKYLTKDFSPFDPKKPDAPEKLPCRRVRLPIRFNLWAVRRGLKKCEAEVSV